jgi:hypothetical protein
MKSQKGKITFSDEQNHTVTITDIKNAWLDQESILIKTKQDSVMFLNYDSESKAMKDFIPLNKLLKKEWRNE